VEAGRSAGCKTILINSAHSDPSRRHESKPDFVAVNLREAVNIVKRHHRTVQDRRIVPAPEISDEQTLAAKSAEILSMAPAEEVEEKTPAPALAPAAAPAGTDRILTNILEQLRRMQKKEEIFGEFSLIRLLAGTVQVFVPFCLLLALLFLLGSRRQDNNVFVALGFAAVLQVMALTFYIMNDRR
jgi:hypothetical protein